jgi:hypothetical protein
VELKKLPFIIAVVLIVLALLIEIGATIAVSGDSSVSAGGVTNGIEQARSTVCSKDDDPEECREDLRDAAEDEETATEVTSGDKPPGLGIPYLALIDAALVFTIGLIALSVFIPGRVTGRVQGVITLIFSIVLLLASLLLTILAFVLLIVMVSLLFAVPFGTIAYLAGFGFFATGAAKAVLAFVMLLKLAFVVCLVISQPRFLQNRGLVLIVLTSLVGTLLVSFLQGLVPSILVSITDAIGAVIVGILAIVWCIVLLIGSIPAIIRALTSGHPTGDSS